MKLGFIGTGNMAGAILKGIIRSGLIRPDEIIGSDTLPSGREHIRKTYGIHVTPENTQAAQQAEMLFLSVKPQFYPAVISEIRDVVRKEQLIITIAPGKTLAWLEEQFGKKVKIVRTMPNTPAMAGEGMTAVCPNSCVDKEELKYVMQILDTIGKTEIVEERLMDAVVSVSGSSPAYVFMMIEAMADAAVAEGMPRPQAYRFAAQAVYGSAKMVLETGKHPGELKDMVCSPAGTTIEAVRILEQKGFRSALMEAMKACAEISRSL